MNVAPKSCPMCGEVSRWKKVDEQVKEFKVRAGEPREMLRGPLGLRCGVFSKLKYLYCCGKCDFSREYE